MIFIFILEYFISLVFLEYIELNCFGLSENTKRNIQKRTNEEEIIENENQIEISNNSNNEDEESEDN